MKCRQSRPLRAGMLSWCAALVAASWSPIARAADVPDAAWNAPSSYYTNLNDSSGSPLVGAALKSRLQTIISSGFVSVAYDTMKLTMPVTDRAYGTTAAQQKMWGVYDRHDLPGYWDNQATWNREHVWPKSLLNGVTDHDLFGVRPAFVAANSDRANYGYGGYDITDTTTQAGLLPKASGASSPLFYAGPYDRGDTARACFYMATRYNGSLSIVPSTNGTTSGAGTLGDLKSMLRANYLDPVDNFERRRNQYIYSNPELADTSSVKYSQRNRNPYVDHPEYVWAVFGDQNANGQVINDSQITVNTADAVGASSKAVSFGRMIVGGAAPTLSTAVAINKSGAKPTTFSVSTSGLATADGVNNAATVRTNIYNTFDYGAGSKSLNVGLSGVTTATAGVKNGTVTVDNTDLTNNGSGTGALDGNDTVDLSLTVLDHANASFDTATDTNYLYLNFQNVNRGKSASLSFSLGNLLSTSGYTAGLDLDSITAAGDTNAFATSLATFSALTAGASNTYTATFSPTQAGTFTATYTLGVSDENLSGATAGTSLTLVMSGVANARYVPEPGMLALAVLAFCSLSRSGRNRAGARAGKRERA